MSCSLATMSCSPVTLFWHSGTLFCSLATMSCSPVTLLWHSGTLFCCLATMSCSLATMSCSPVTLFSHSATQFCSLPTMSEVETSVKPETDSRPTYQHPSGTQRQMADGTMWLSLFRSQPTKCNKFPPAASLYYAFLHANIYIIPDNNMGLTDPSPAHTNKTEVILHCWSVVPSFEAALINSQAFV